MHQEYLSCSWKSFLCSCFKKCISSILSHKLWIKNDPSLEEYRFQGCLGGLHCSRVWIHNCISSRNYMSLRLRYPPRGQVWRRLMSLAPVVIAPSIIGAELSPLTLNACKTRHKGNSLYLQDPSTPRGRKNGAYVMASALNARDMASGPL